MSDKPSSQPPVIQSKFLDSKGAPLRQHDVATNAFEKVNHERQTTANAAEKAASEPRPNQTAPQLHALKPQMALQMKGPLAQGPNREAFVARQQMTDRYAREQIEKAKAQHDAGREKSQEDKGKDIGERR